MGAIVHTHSIHATALGLLKEELLPLTEELEHVVRITPFAPSGSRELAKRVGQTLAKGGNAVILERHGVVGAGRNLKEAFRICQVVERNAQIHLLTKGLARKTK